MDRILVVLRGRPDVHVLRRRVTESTAGVRGPYAIAICHVPELGTDTLERQIRAQREITALLRSVLGPSAEEVAVFVASERPGDGVDDCAKAWGATFVAA